MDKLIEVYLTLNFEELYKVCNQYAAKGEEQSTPSQLNAAITFEKVKNLKVQELEQIGKEFLKTYKQKIEQIFKEIRMS